MGIIAHYITDSSQLDHFVIALRELDGEHIGENQALVAIQVISDYGIALKLGYFVMDNASNNDTLVVSLSERMNLNPILIAFTNSATLNRFKI